MNYTNVMRQARINSLSVGKREIAVDGMFGPASRAAEAQVMKELGVSKRDEIFDDSDILGLIWHWTAGRNVPSKDDLKHYNDVWDHLGNHYDGGARIEHQTKYDWRKGIGVSHTKNCNTGYGGLSVAGMHGANGWPSMEWGNDPITWEGIDGMLERSAEYCKEFNIPVSRWTTLSHAEVQKTLGIKQNNKWDYMILPGMTRVMDPVTCGDILRKRLIERHM